MRKFFILLLVALVLGSPSMSTAFAADEPTTSQDASTEETEKASEATAKPAYCPAEPPAAGPTAGEDYQQAIARAFNQEVANSGYRDSSELGGTGSLTPEPDKNSENIVVEIAKKYAPGSDGKTKYKYSVNGDGPSVFDCSGFVHSVLKQAKSKGAKVTLGSHSFTGAYSGVGRLIHKADLKKNSKGGAKLRSSSDLPSLNMLRPGDLIFFGTSTACSNDRVCPNEVGHIGIYLGNGKYIHSTTSDEDLSKDSASRANNYVEPPISAHAQGPQYRDYNGVKVSDFKKSYFTPDFYIMVRRVIPETISGGPTGAVAGLGTTTTPGGKNAYISFRSCHGSSLCNPSPHPGHGVYRNRPNGDAVDIKPKDGYGIAVFNGTAVSGGSGRNSYTVLTSENRRVKAYYYHTRNVKQGKVQVGDRIVRTGVAGIHHIHFELLVDGKSVNGRLVFRREARQYVKSLWENMKYVLGIV